MPGPVQHITAFTVVMDTTGNETAGLNADQPSGYPNAWPGGITDPSTNNLVMGPTLVRNQIVSGGAILNRTLRSGGSGRPQYRVPGTVGSSNTQKAGTEFGNSAGLVKSLSFTSQPVSGHLMVAVIMTESPNDENGAPDTNVTISTVTNNTGTAYTQAGSTSRYIDDGVADTFHPSGVPQNAYGLSLWYLVSTGAAADQSVKVTCPSPAAGKNPAINLDLDIIEYPGLTATPFDVSTTTTHPSEHSSSTLDGGSVTPTVKDLLLACFAPRGPYIVLPSSGWTGVFRWEDGGGNANDPPPGIPARVQIAELFSTPGGTLVTVAHRHDSSGATPYAAPYCGLTVGFKRT